jgi:integrase
MEQGQDRRSEGPLQAERDLGYSRSATTLQPSPGTRPVQSCHRQQTPCLRSRKAQGARHLSRSDRSLSDNCDATKDQRPVQFEITEPTREAVWAWISHARLSPESCLFPSRLHGSTHRSLRQYARIVDSWVRQLGLDRASYETHTLRRTKATLIYRRTKNLRAVQLLLGHSKLESTVRYLGIEVNDALEMAEQTEV